MLCKGCNKTKKQCKCEDEQKATDQLIRENEATMPKHRNEEYPMFKVKKPIKTIGFKRGPKNGPGFNH